MLSSLAVKALCARKNLVQALSGNRSRSRVFTGVVSRSVEPSMHVHERIVGLDIGSSAIKAVELVPTSQNGCAYEVIKLGLEALPSGAIVGGVIENADAVARAIGRLFKEQKIETGNVALSVSGDGVHWPTVTLPHLTPREFAESIAWEAEQYICYDIKDVLWDYEVLDDGGPGGEMTVRFVAMKKDKIGGYADVIRQAGNNLAIRELDLFALQNCYEFNYQEDPGRVVALLNVGASIVNIDIVKGRRSIFSQEFHFGGNQYTEAIKDEVGLSFEDAEALKRGRGGVATSHNLPVILRMVSENMASKIHQTRDFLCATTAEANIDLILLSGGAAKTPGLREVLGERLQVDVEILNPFKRIRYNPKRVDPTLVESVGSSAALAVGLAARLSASTGSVPRIVEPSGRLWICPQCHRHASVGLEVCQCGFKRTESDNGGDPPR
jgi:type IV pilus assembly protein PilM